MVNVQNIFTFVIQNKVNELTSAMLFRWGERLKFTVDKGYWGVYVQFNIKQVRAAHLLI